jgi:hypothetical protein
MSLDKKQLETAGTYQAQAPLRSILEDIDEIGNYLLEIQNQRRKLRRYGGIAMISGLLLAIAASILRINALTALTFLAFAAGVGLYIYSFVYGRAMHTHHSRYELLKNLFDVLQRDADPRSPFSVKLALKPQPALLKEEPWPDRKNGQQKFFEEDYLSIEGELLDGTVLSENLTELTRKRSFTNPSGKSKTKTRSRYILALKFRYPNDVYADARPAHQALHEQIRVPPSATVRETRVDEKAITVKSMVQSEKDVVQTTAMSCLGAYRILNLARRVAAAGGAK